jgi:GNAT superfamily N-acetyltransferase
MPGEFEIRAATVADAAAIAQHRARMFQEMGLVPGPLFESYRAQCEIRLREMLASGEYLGWLGFPIAESEKIVAGAGVQLRRTLPHPVGEPGGEITLAEGRHAIVINVFTEPDWRRRGLATLLMGYLLDWARAQRLDRLVLHATPEGRIVYERLGFVQTNEMRFKDRLDTW